MPDDSSARTGGLLSIIQRDFPIESRPFRPLAERLGRTEQSVIAEVKSLIRNRVIREFGPVFVPAMLGYTSTLVAAHIETDRAAEFSAAILLINEITHNYFREGEFNIWFTVTAPDRGHIDSIIRWAEKFPGVSMVLDLPVVKTFKINVVFDAESFRGPDIAADTIPFSPGEDDRIVIRTLQNGLPIVERPFLALAEESGLDETLLIDRVREWIDRGIIRRFGARVNQRRIGYANNVLAAWQGEEIDELGERFSALPQVSHCYERKSYPEWPYRLYTMIHARTETDMELTLGEMRRIAPSSQYVAMPTLYELKKTSMKYFLGS
jgi:siroheme decarboxylase